MKAGVVDINPSLRSVQHAFDQWRSTRTRRQPTPMALRRCAVALLDQHCAFHVCRALRINANALKQWSGAPSAATRSTSPQPSVDAQMSAGFVRLPDAEEIPVDQTAQETNTLLIELPNRSVIRAHRAFTLDELFQAAFSVGEHTSLS